MLEINFPPKPVRSLNPFGIATPTETEIFLRALQRAAAASLAVFVFLRYGPALQARLPSFLRLGAITLIGGYCLSAPATFLGLGALMIYRDAVHISRDIQEKNMIYLAIDIALMAGSYIIFDRYEDKVMKFPFLSSPNYLDKFFISTAENCSFDIYNRVFKRKT